MQVLSTETHPSGISTLIAAAILSSLILTSAVGCTGKNESAKTAQPQKAKTAGTKKSSTSGDLSTHQKRMEEYSKQMDVKKDRLQKGRAASKRMRTLKELPLHKKWLFVIEGRDRDNPNPFDPRSEVKYADKTWENESEVNQGRQAFVGIALETLMNKRGIDSKTLAEGVTFCGKALKGHYPSGDSDRCDWDELFVEANRLHQTALGEDQFFLTMASIVALNAFDTSTSNEWIDKALAKFQKSAEYPERIYAFAATWDVRNRYKSELSQSLSAKYSPTAGAIYNWLITDFRAKPSEHRFVFELINDHCVFCRARGTRENKLHNELRAIVIKDVALPPWVKEMLKARFFYDRAWTARGSGYANTVSGKGWDQFAEYNETAVEHAENALEINPHLPHAASTLLSLSMLGFGDGEDMSREYFEKTIEAQFDFPAAYSTFLHFNRPRWGGGIDDVLEFAVECYETERYDTRVPFQIVEVTAQVFKESSKDDMITMYKTEGYFEKLTDCLTKYIENAPPKEKKYLASIRAILTFKFGRKDEAIKQVIKLGEKVEPAALNLLSYYESSTYWTGMVLAKEEEHAEWAYEIQEFFNNDLVYRLENQDEGNSIIENGLRDNIDPFEKAYFGRYQEHLKVESAFDAGEWAELSFIEGIPSHNGSHIDRHTVLGEKTIKLDSTRGHDRHAAYIHSMPETPGPKSVEATVEILEPTISAAEFDAGLSVIPEYAPHFMTGGFFGRQQNTFQLLGAQNVAAIAFKDQLPPKRRLRMNITDGYVEFFVEGQFIGGIVDSNITPTARFAFGSRYDTIAKGKVIVSDIRVRKWDMPPRPASMDSPNSFSLSEAQDWLNKAIEFFPETPYYHYRMALAHFNAGEYEKAAELASKAKTAGCSPHKTSLLIGFLSERTGDEEAAAKAYSDSENTELRYRIHYVPFPRGSKQNSEYMARCNRFWLRSTSKRLFDAELLFDEAGGKRTVPHRFAHPEVWVNARLNAANYANRQQFSDAKTVLENALAKKLIPDEYMKETNAQLAAYKRQEPWFRDDETPSFLVDKMPFVTPTKPLVNWLVQ